MAKILYTHKNFSTDVRATIARANSIIEEYADQGFVLTLRQLYYQFVARDLIPNTFRSYKRLGTIVSDGRLAGLIDWDAIQDRTRNVRRNSHWTGPGQIIRSAAEGYEIDKWADQEYRPEVWIEKDALVGVIEGVCVENDVPYFSCRGYNSQSEMHSAALRMMRQDRGALGGRPIIFHLGDHDPSGKDMTRDTVDRMAIFSFGSETEIEVQRLALNMPQVEQYNPPPNPAKVTDSRAAEYIAEYGDESWELDALEPAVMVDLIQVAIDGIRDLDLWRRAQAKEEEGRSLLQKTADQWQEVTEFLEEN
jgi:hypothetical protein